MLKVDYSVLVFVGGDTDLPDIGLSGGVCTWDNATGILEDEWWGNLSNSVDISYGGNYEAYSPTSIAITRTSIVEITLRNYGLTLLGKRIEIHETSSHGTTVIRRGVVSGLVNIGNSVNINVSHVTNKYNANLTPRVGDSYSHLVYGENVDSIPLIVDSDQTVTTGEIGDKLYPSFVVVRSDEYYSTIRSSYDNTYVTIEQLATFAEKSEYFLLEGENNSMIAKPIYQYFYENVNGVDYATMITILQPMNIKDENHEDYLPIGTTVIAKYVSESYVYTPYGISPNQDNLKYEKDGVLYPFPSYVDSLKYYSDSIGIIDADNSGVVFIEPQNGAYFSTVQEMQSVLDKTYYPSNGFAFYSDGNTSMSSYSGSFLDSEFITDRTQSQTYTSSEISFVGKNNGNTGFCDMTTSITYAVQNPSDYNNIFTTAIVEYANIHFNGAPVPVYLYYYYSVSVYAITATNEYHPRVTIYASSEIGNESGLGDQSIFPVDVSNDGINERYRYSNDSHFGLSEVLGGDIDLLQEFSFSETELRNPIKFLYTVGFGWSMPLSSDELFSAEIPKIRLAFTSREEYQLDQLYIENASNGDDIVDVRNAYVDTCSKQNFESLGITPPSDGWGLSIPSGGVDAAVNITDITANAPLTELIYKTDSTGTKKVKYDLLRYGFGVGYIDSLGLESWADINTMYTGGVLITAYDVVGKPTVKNYDSNKVYCDIGVKSNIGNIEVKNTEQTIYSDDYVSGIDSNNDKKALWFSGNLLYQEYAVKNEFPSNISDSSNVVDSVLYIKNQYLIQGVVNAEVDGSPVSTLFNRYTLSFTVPTEFCIVNSLWVGVGITFSYPHVASARNGIITGINRNIKDGQVSITAEMVGELIASSEEHVIIESGAQVDNIVESGDRETNYVEVI